VTEEVAVSVMCDLEKRGARESAWKESEREEREERKRTPHRFSFSWIF
jgi:hypothetical protein